jgi:hypothetical protein
MQPSIPKLFEEYRDLAESVGSWKAQVLTMQSEIFKAETRMAQIEKTLKSATKEKAIDEVRPDGYRTAWTNLHKAVFILKAEKRYLTVRQIVEAIAIIEGIDDIRKLISTMSSTLSTNASKNKTVARFKDQDGQDWIYGLVDWDKTPNHG